MRVVAYLAFGISTRAFSVICACLVVDLWGRVGMSCLVLSSSTPSVLVLLVAWLLVVLLFVCCLGLLSCCCCFVMFLELSLFSSSVECLSAFGSSMNLFCARDQQTLRTLRRRAKVIHGIATAPTPTWSRSAVAEQQVGEDPLLWLPERGLKGLSTKGRPVPARASEVSLPR